MSITYLKHLIFEKLFMLLNFANKVSKRAQRLINLEIPVLVRLLKSSNVELGYCSSVA